MNTKAQVNEWEVMAKLYELLKPCDTQSRERMFMAVNSKLIAEAPKARLRKKRTKSLDLPDAPAPGPACESDRASRDWAERAN